MEDEYKVNKTMFIVMTVSLWLPELIIFLLPNNILFLVIKFFAAVFLFQRLFYNFRKDFNHYVSFGLNSMYNAAVFPFFILLFRTQAAYVLLGAILLNFYYVFLKVDSYKKK